MICVVYYLKMACLCNGHRVVSISGVNGKRMRAVV